MGNAVISSQCFRPNPNSGPKLIFFDGTTRLLAGNKTRIAGEITFESPESMVCDGDSFFIGQPVPSLGIHDRLIPGKTYFVLPVDRFGCGALSAATLAAFAASPVINFGSSSPFEYLRGGDGRVLIKVSPEFIAGLITKSRVSNGGGGAGGFLCSTPELQKQYEMLVGSKEQIWSPKLETISEHKIRFSPCRFIGLDWKSLKEK